MAHIDAIRFPAPLPHNLPVCSLHAKEYIPELKEWADVYDLTDRYIWVRAKRADPSLHYRKHAKKYVLTHKNVKERIATAKKLQLLTKEKLRCVVFLDEATVNWDVQPPHYIANAGTPEYIWPDVPNAKRKAWAPGMMYLSAVNSHMGMVYKARVGHDIEVGLFKVSFGMGLEHSIFFEELGDMSDDIVEEHVHHDGIKSDVDSLLETYEQILESEGYYPASGFR